MITAAPCLRWTATRTAADPMRCGAGSSGRLSGITIPIGAATQELSGRAWMPIGRPRLRADATGRSPPMSRVFAKAGWAACGGALVGPAAASHGEHVAPARKSAAVRASARVASAVGSPAFASPLAALHALGSLAARFSRGGRLAEDAHKFCHHVRLPRSCIS